MCLPANSFFNTSALTFPASDRGGSFGVLFPTLSEEVIFSAWRTTYTVRLHDIKHKPRMAKKKKDLILFYFCLVFNQVLFPDINSLKLNSYFISEVFFLY